MPEHSDLALVSTLVLVGLTCVIGIETLDKTSAIEVGCLQLLATGQKDLPPVHICRYAAQFGSAPSSSPVCTNDLSPLFRSSHQGDKLQTESLSKDDEPDYMYAEPR